MTRGTIAGFIIKLLTKKIEIMRNIQFVSVNVLMLMINSVCQRNVCKCKREDNYNPAVFLLFFFILIN